MTIFFKPLLATTLDDVTKLNFPVYASAKLDGYRCIMFCNHAISRNMKPIRNNYIRERLQKHADVLNGFDGELCLANLTAPFNEVSSAVSAADGEPDFRYVVFDHHHDNTKGYKERFLDKLDRDLPDFVQVVPYALVTDVEGLLRMHAQWTEAGYEGTMIRPADGLDYYKHGRSTQREGILLKLKDFVDTEATVIGFIERMHNGNEATTNALGHTERSSHKANMIPANTLGALIVTCDEFDSDFEIGTGFDDATRSEIWKNQRAYLGKTVNFQHQPSGAKIGGKPRFPSFRGFRDDV